MSKTDYLDLAQHLVDKAIKLGAQQAEVYINMTNEMEIEVNKQQVETMKVSEDRGIGIRVLNSGSIGFAYSTDFDLAKLEETVKLAVANGRITSPMNTIFFPLNRVSCLCLI
ncbi:MAG: DNA gyrase modulator [Bacillota bacterium]|nr:DNA gyrase modulator [Bacillota bacterium]